MYTSIVTAIHDGTLDEHDAETLIAACIAADDLYHNDDESFLSDPEYDALRLFARRLNPAHIYFTGVGTNVRGGKVKLPFEMGSLDQVEIGGITDWIGNWGLQNEDVVITDKLDGTSGMNIHNTTGALQISYSRGNGTEGADITRHIKQFKSIPDSTGVDMTVRGEVIFTKTDFPKIQKGILSHGGREYKNARNTVAGIMNRKDNVKYGHLIFNHIRFVAYEILNFKGSKLQMLQTLEAAGYEVPSYEVFKGSDLSDTMLAAFLNERRDTTEYEIDGVVIDVDSAATRKRMNPTRDTLNPAYSIKYKVADATNKAVVEVVGVEWKASKHGMLKPRVNIKPTELVGVTITYATGFNAKFINDNGIGPGAKVQITRSGDVIPFIQKVVQKATPALPKGDWSWNETGVDIVLNDKGSDDNVVIGQLVAFFTSIDAPHLKEGSVTKLFDAGFKTPADIIQLFPNEFRNILGANGTKVHAGLQKALTDIPYYKLFGAYANERGIGVRKIKKLQEALGLDVLQSGNLAVDEIARVPGFESTTAKKIAMDWMKFQNFLKAIDGYYTIEAEKKVGTKLADQKIVFSGFRDKDLQAAVESAGGTMQSALSSKTTILVVKDPNGTSSKIKKAQDLGTKILGIDDFKRMV